MKSAVVSWCGGQHVHGIRQETTLVPDTTVVMVLETVISCAVNIQKVRLSVQQGWYDYAE